MSNSKYYIKAKINSRKIWIDGKEHDRLIWLHSNDLLSLADHLDNKYPEWLWFNVYDNMNKDQQIASFTKYKRPVHKLVISYERYVRSH